MVGASDTELPTPLGPPGDRKVFALMRYLAVGSWAGAVHQNTQAVIRSWEHAVPPRSPERGWKWSQQSISAHDGTLTAHGFQSPRL